MPSETTSGTPDRIRVRHVDDEPDVAGVTGKYLQRQRDRFDVEVVASVDEGLSLLEAEPFGCVVSDDEMPGLSGVAFRRAVRDRYPNVPVILVTGKGTEAIASDAIPAGVTDYLRKETGTGQYEVLADRIEPAVRPPPPGAGGTHRTESATSSPTTGLRFC
jgi:DNA-binding NtrC family response regulator